MLVHHPHDFAGVHGGTAANGDNAIRLESVHGRHTLFGASQGGVRCHIKECGVGHAHFVQFISDGLGVAILIQEAVRNNECLFLLHHIAHFVQRHRQAAFLNVHLLRGTEPQHIFPSFCNGFDVHQVLDPYILRHGVAAPGAAAQGQGRCQLKVVQVADTAERGRGIHQHTAGLHLGGECVQLLLLGHSVQIYGRGMTVTAVCNQLGSLFQCVIKVLGFIHSQHRAQLFVGKLLANVYALHLADEHLGLLGNGHAGQCRNGHRLLTHDLCVQGAIDNNGFAHLVNLVRFQEVAASILKFLAHRLVDLLVYNAALLGGADHTVIKSLGMDNGVHRQLNICGIINNGGGVTGANAQGRLAAGVRGLYHTGAAGCQNGVCLFHQQVGHIQGRCVNPADDPLRRAGCHSSVQHDLGRSSGALLGPGMGRDDNAVAGLQANQGLKDGRRGGVGGGDHRRNHAQRLCDLLNTVGLIFLDHAAGFGVLVCIINVLCRGVVLDDLVFYQAHAGLFHRHLGQGNSCLIGSHGRRKENFIHLLLGVSGELPLRCAHTVQLRLQLFYAVDDFSCHFIASKSYLLS